MQLTHATKKVTRKEFLAITASMAGGVVLGKLIGTKGAVALFARLRGVALAGYGSSPYGGKK